MDEILSYHRALAAHITHRLQRIEQQLNLLTDHQHQRKESNHHEPE